jgi:flagellum-specific peptidoglycan hydrolase FlgJ
VDQNILDLIADASVAAEKATGIPAELPFAQCALESGWLAHAPGNNCFGIKCYQGQFGRQLLNTKEWFNDAELQHFLSQGDSRTATLDPGIAPMRDGRRRYTVQDWFASFHSLSECFSRRAALFQSGRYASFAQAYAANKSFEALVRGIAPIYATDPNYANQILQIAHQANVQNALSRARAKLAQPA